MTNFKRPKVKLRFFRIFPSSFLNLLELSQTLVLSWNHYYPFTKIKHFYKLKGRIYEMYETERFLRNSDLIGTFFMFILVNLTKLNKTRISSERYGLVFKRLIRLNRIKILCIK